MMPSRLFLFSFIEGRMWKIEPDLQLYTLRVSSLVPSASILDHGANSRARTPAVKSSWCHSILEVRRAESYLMIPSHYTRVIS